MSDFCPLYFQKRPLTIEAVQLSANNMVQVERWCGGSIKGTKLPPEQRRIDIQTLEGEMSAEIGDWIIKGVEGEFYPCKDSIFKKSYRVCV